jgi:hypothetical protein
MTSKTSSVDFGVIANDTSQNDWQLLEKDRQAQEQWDRNEKEIEARRRKEDPDATLRAYRYSHFFCNRTKTVIPKKDEASIIEHKSTCPYCSKEIEDLKKAKQAWVDALSSMRYILGMIERCKDDIEIEKRKIARETKEKQQGWDTVVMMSRTKIKELERVIEREQINKHKMLNPDLNNLNDETLTQAVNDMHMQYVKLPPEKKKHFENYMSYKAF